MRRRAWAAGVALLVAPAWSSDQAVVREDRPAPIYSEKASDSWNRIHHLLFTRRVRSGIAGGPTDPVRQVERVEGGDVPEFLVLPDADYLLESRRYRDLVKALEAEIAAPSAASRTVEARVMFQQDLWNRFDAVHGFLSSEHPDATRSRACRLRDLLGRAMARVACTPTELAGIRSSFADSAEAFPEVLDPGTFSNPSSWRELVSTVGDRPVEQDTTLHAQRAGYRIVFRRFVRVPETAGGVRCLEEAASREGEGPPDRCSDGALPEGSRAVLLETPLALASDGRIVPVPLIVGLQSRTVASPAAFHVLHASRMALARPPVRGGGLLALSQDALIPQSASAFRRFSGQPLMPVRTSCPLCHGSRGEALGTSRLHIRPRTQVLLPDNTIEQDRVVRAKRAEVAYETLRGLFAANGSPTRATIRVMSSCWRAPAAKASAASMMRSITFCAGKSSQATTVSARRSSPHSSPSGFMASLTPSVNPTRTSPASRPTSPCWNAAASSRPMTGRPGQGTAGSAAVAGRPSAWWITPSDVARNERPVLVNGTARYSKRRKLRWHVGVCGARSVTVSSKW